MIGALQRGEADRRILQRRDQRELTRKTLAELLFVIGGAGPRLLLRFAVVLAGQFLDAGCEDRRQHGRILRKERPQSRFGQRLSHHAHQAPITFSASTSAPAINSHLSAM